MIHAVSNRRLENAPALRAGSLLYKPRANFMSFRGPEALRGRHVFATSAPTDALHCFAVAINRESEPREHRGT
jgi:hypothetical protein